jgi:nucleoside-diphosphate-sugar epimerase
MREIRNANCCVVGGAGFLGSHLVDYLIESRNCKVLVIDNLCAGRREFIHGRADFQYADITESESYLCKLFSSRNIQFVFNYAAYPYIPDSFDRPIHVAEVNFTGAAKVINAAAEAGCTAILQISSAEIYGEGTRDKTTPGGRLSEDAPVIPHSTYGASKAAVDALVQVRWKEAETPVIALRQFNCVGPRETHPYIVPEIISQLSTQGDKHHFDGRFCRDCGVGIEYQEHYHWELCSKVYQLATIRLGNNSFRDFLYAGDQATMATELLEKGQFGEVYNLGSEEGIFIYDLAKLIGKLMGFNGVEIVPDPSRIRPWEIWHLQSDNTKIYSVIESRPTHSLEDALIKAIDDYRSHGSKWCWEK